MFNHIKNWKSVFLFIFILILNSCASYMELSGKNREKLSNLQLGMSKTEVISTMGNKPFSIPGGDPDIIQNPYRTEMRQDGNDTFEVIYYYSDIKSRDGAITDDELTPIILKNGKVIGWGHSNWNDLNIKIMK